MGKQKSTKRQKLKLSISEKKYKQLITHRKSKKKMSSKDKKLLDKALYVKYCKCLKEFEFRRKVKRGYPIFINSIYKNRGFTPTKNASKKFGFINNKNVGK